MFQVGEKVIRKGEHRDAQWQKACRDLGVPEGSPFVVKDYGQLVIKLEGMPMTWDASYFTKVPDVQEATVSSSQDAVRSPSHYQFFPGTEAIEIIAASLTKAEFKGYCMGNRLKYRLRAGNKDKLEQDIQKSDFYLELYSRHVDKCKAD